MKLRILKLQINNFNGGIINMTEWERHFGSVNRAQVCSLSKFNI